MPKGGKQPGAGRPKGAISKSTKEALAFKEYLIKRVIKEKNDLITALLTKAKSGDVMAIRELLDRALGKAKESVELTGSEGGAIEIDLTIKQIISKVYGRTEGQKSD